jgi:hypothetical protein
MLIIRKRDGKPDRTQKFRVLSLKLEQKMGMNFPERFFAKDLFFHFTDDRMYWMDPPNLISLIPLLAPFN